MLDIATCEKLMATCRNPANGKPIANNTRLFIHTEGYRVRYHRTDVVTILHTGEYRLATGGWKTNTTKERIEGNSPARIIQLTIDGDRRWYLPTIHGAKHVNAYGRFDYESATGYKTMKAAIPRAVESGMLMEWDGGPVWINSLGVVIG